MKKTKLFLLTTLIFLLLLPVSVSAASRYKNQFVRDSKGMIYYYNAQGQKNPGGLLKVGKYTYYLDKNRIQRTGWQKIGKYYYFFRIRNGKAGYMITSKTINGIKLDKNGRAVYNSAGLAKLKVMVKANQVLESVINYKMTKEQKLRAAYNKLIKYRYRNFGPFLKSDPAWDVTYATRMLFNGSGDCYCGGAAIAYLANAAGYTTVYAESSGGHGWAEIDGKFYDPNWAFVTGKPNDYFAVPPSLSGVGGRPRYKNNRWYKKRI